MREGFRSGWRTSLRQDEKMYMEGNNNLAPDKHRVIM